MIGNAAVFVVPNFVAVSASCRVLKKMSPDLNVVQTIAGFQAELAEVHSRHFDLNEGTLSVGNASIMNEF